MKNPRMITSINQLRFNDSSSTVTLGPEITTLPHFILEVCLLYTLSNRAPTNSILTGWLLNPLGIKFV